MSLKYAIDRDYFEKCFLEMIATPSPVGYYTEMNPLMEKYAGELGCETFYDNKSNLYFVMEGQDNSKTVQVSAHSDTLGLIVRTVDKDGMIRTRNLGGINYANLDGETVTIHTRDGRKYTGLITCQSHSSHVFDDARTSIRDENTMMILLDEPHIRSREDVYALGIRHGDPISIDPRPEITENGFFKSRYIDNKGSIACVLAGIKYLREHNLKPKYRTYFSFPNGEEIKIAAVYVPPEVSEYVALDIGLIGPDYAGNEYGVTICAKDNISVYDRDLTTRLTQLAEEAGCDYAVDIFYHYSTDASHALQAGNNVRVAAFGMPVYCSHGRERTHWDSLNNTTNLLISYLLNR